MNDEYLNLSEVKHLVRTEHELGMLKKFLADKLTKYSGITHSELETICTMLGITKKKEEQPDEQSHPDRQTGC